MKTAQQTIQTYGTSPWRMWIVTIAVLLCGLAGVAGMVGLGVEEFSHFLALYVAEHVLSPEYQVLPGDADALHFDDEVVPFLLPCEAQNFWC